MSDEKKETEDMLPPMELKPNTTEQRIKHVEHSTTIAQRIEAKLVRIEQNYDIAGSAGGVTYFSLFVLSVQNGQWKEAIFNLTTAVLFVLMKNKLPAGPVAKFLRRSPHIVVDKFKETFSTKV